MFDLYTAVVLTALLLIIITIVDVLSNRLITKRTKKWAVIACLLIAGSALSECIGVLSNGAPESFIVLHRIAKLAEFCFAPAIGVAVAMAYGLVKKPGAAIIAVAVHSVFECVAFGFQWVFRIDAQNMYHREKLYWVYVAVFICSIAYCIICIVRNRRVYQIGFVSVLILTIIFILIGIGIQFIDSEIRIDFLCIAIGNMLFYSCSYKMLLATDAVTNLLNRRCYDAYLESAGVPAVIIFFDINNFKQVNDTQGHNTGDICLKKIAQVIYNVYGRYGLCYRIGGDEFCVIMDKNLDAVRQLNDRFEASVHELQKGDNTIPDAALGYARYTPGVSHIHDVVKEADAMMYSNKKSLYADLCSVDSNAHSAAQI